MRGKKLLLIEDDEDDYIITRDLLDEIAEGKYVLDWASHPDQAREWLAQNRHDVCLMDYTLGAEDGLALLKEAPKLGFKSPVIMLTGQDDPELDAMALQAGAVDFLVKSQLNPSRLARAIRYAVARRDMEQERLERLKAEAENRSKSEFLAHLSHELRTPLTAILGYTDLIISKTRDDSIQDFLEITKRNGHHLLSLLNDVLDLSKIEAGKLEIEQSVFELVPFLEDLYSLMSVKAKDKNIDLTFIAKNDLPKYIESDPTRLRQILINLIGNAIKFTHQGTVQVNISETGDADHTCLVVEIIDTGIGIEPQQIKQLFTPFSQLKDDHPNQEKGSGLGLAISRQLALSLGGDIQVRSQPGQGSAFTLELNLTPVQQDQRQPLSLLDMQAHQRQTSLQSQPLHGNILVADDVGEIRQLVGHIISQAGAMVSYASDGEEAVNKVMNAEAGTQPFDLVIMDVQMPKLNGLDATQVLRQKGFDRPILALTAATMKGERERCLALGCSEHLSKPINPDQLLQTIANFLPSEEPETVARLLLVEDDADACSATAQLLEMLGWEVHTAHNGNEALTKAKTLMPQVTLIDIQLPDMDGRELSQQLLAVHSGNSRLIAVTGSQLSDHELEQYGFDAHLLKPINLEKLRQL